MATNHEVGSSNLSERTTFISLETAPEQCSGAVFVESDLADSGKKAQLKSDNQAPTWTKLGHFLTVGEAADRLGISAKTIRRWCESGKLPAIEKSYGKTVSYLISLSAVEMLIISKNQRKEASETKADKMRKDNSKPHVAFMKAWETAMTRGMMTGKPFSPNTIELYHSNVEKFTNRHDKVCFKTVQAALMAIPARQYAKKARLYEALICFAKFLAKEGALEAEFFDEVKPLKPKRHLPPKRTTVDEKGLQALLKACETSLDRLVVILPASTGLRASEVCRLRWGDIDLEKGCLTVKIGKGGKTRRVGLPAMAVEALEQYKATIESPVKGSTYILLNRDGKPMDRHGLRQRLERLGDEAGVTVTPHALRRAFVTINAGKGRSLVYLQRACGHSNIQTTMAYCQMNENEVIEAMKGWD